jgi:flagellar basal-body rod modification protein FlgD
MSTINGLGATITDQVAAKTSSPSSNSSTEINKSDFLQLLVAQLKHQDPMNPVDNQQFITQLATFSSLEQLISINASVTELVGGSEKTGDINNLFDSGFSGSGEN